MDNETSTATDSNFTTSIHSTRSAEAGSGPTQASLIWLILVLLLVSVALFLFLLICLLRKRKARKWKQSRVRERQQRVSSQAGHMMVKVLPSPKQPALGQGPSHPLNITWLPARGPSLQPVHFTIRDLSLLEVLKVGQQGRFYRAKITRGNCKGHRLVTCKLTMRTVSQKKMKAEISIMKKLGYHKNVIQLLEWNILEEPYILIMEHVGSQNLKSFLQMNREQLSGRKDLLSQLTLAGYFISLGMQHIASKKIAHRDLAARNILVGRFPQECKIAEFSLATDCSDPLVKLQKKGSGNFSIPFRWYPPEYFTDGIYNLQGDVWAYGILLWELYSLGSSPYPEFETAKEVVYNICSGYKMKAPRQCRHEVYEVMGYCWTDRHEERPPFSDISKYLEDLVENDADYIQVEECFEPSTQLNTDPPWSLPHPHRTETPIMGWLDSV
ncbi:tyrosine kinase receptor Cad96Ca isoform X2 [Hypanus sabinus]|uniref:tyrosine kinase receptor Cad96Ca isoform X2 n=1 Tax=Hypanus sabinus TaxID=79690 RepID=UPI0028C4EC79|nr:tyrosine kinase receptor Cad96Ca isoform X2 [Hypanus sabinus]